MFGRRRGAQSWGRSGSWMIQPGTEFTESHGVVPLNDEFGGLPVPGVSLRPSSTGGGHARAFAGASTFNDVAGKGPWESVHPAAQREAPVKPRLLPVATWAAAALAVLPPVAFGLGLLIWNEPITDPLWGFAWLGGLGLGAVAGILGIVAIARANPLPGVSAVCTGAVAVLVSFVTFGVASLALVPTWGDHTGPGTCENEDVVVQLAPSQDYTSGNVTFLVTSQGDRLWEEGWNRYSFGEITGQNGSTRISGDWEVLPGDTRAVSLHAESSLPAGPWREFTFVYGVGSHHTRLRCDISGDGIPTG